MSKLEQKILDILKEDVEYEVVGGPTPSETLKGPLDYAKNVKAATVPQATALPGVGTVGDDDADKNADITDVEDHISEDEDDDSDDKKDDKKDDDNDDDKDTLEETFASLLARLAEEDESDHNDDDDEDDSDDDKKEVKEDSEGSSAPKETLPDVDSKLDSPDELVSKAPGSPVAEDEGSKTPKETLPGEEIDSLMDEPDKLVTKAPGSPVAEAEKVQEDLDAIFAGSKLSESAKKKIATVFTAAVTRRVNEEKSISRKIASKKLKEAFAVLQAASEKKAKVFESKLTEKVDGYLNFVVENWMTENRLAVERGIQAQLSEGFIRGLKQLFVEHYIEVPESKVDVVKTLASKVTKLESKLNEQVETNVKMRNSLSAYRRAEVVSQVGSGLADTQKAKLAKLAEGVEYTTRKEFATKLNDLKEAYFPKVASPKKDEVLTESASTPTATTSSSNEMDMYVNTLKKLKKD